MEQDRKLLQSIVENARMGEDACDQLLSRAEDERLRQEIMQEKQTYADTVRAAEERMAALNMDPHPKGMMDRMGMWMGMQIKTMTDRSADHIADLMIQGAGMGVIEITRAVNSNPDAAAESKGIAEAMIAAQQQAIDRLKAFLGAPAVVK